jgi:hypothetical protein
MAETHELKRAVIRFYDRLNDALRTGRLDLLDDVLAPEAIDHNPVPGMAPGRRTTKTKSRRHVRVGTRKKSGWTMTRLARQSVQRRDSQTERIRSHRDRWGRTTDR